MKSYARHISTEAALSTIIADVRQSNKRTMDAKTFDDYMEALKDLYVIEDRLSNPVRTPEELYFVMIVKF